MKILCWAVDRQAGKDGHQWCVLPSFFSSLPVLYCKGRHAADLQFSGELLLFC